jgi:hypothetical protein
MDKSFHDLSEHDKRVAEVAAKAMADFCKEQECEPFPELLYHATRLAEVAVTSDEEQGLNLNRC